MFTCRKRSTIGQQQGLAHRTQPHLWVEPAKGSGWETDASTPKDVLARPTLVTWFPYRDQLKNAQATRPAIRGGDCRACLREKLGERTESQ